MEILHSWAHTPDACPSSNKAELTLGAGSTVWHTHLGGRAQVLELVPAAFGKLDWECRS